MKTTFTLFVCLLSGIATYAQEKISYRNPNKTTTEFKVSPSVVYVEPDAGKAIAARYKVESKGRDFALISQADKVATGFKQQQQLLKQEFKRTEPVLEFKDGTTQICHGAVIIKLKDPAALNRVFKDHPFTFKEDPFVKAQFIVQLKEMDTYAVFGLIDSLQNDKDIEFIEPDFIRMIKPATADPFFTQQWAVNNTGNPAVSMHVEPAWGITTGQGIKVAVIDEGVQLNHPDLQGNLLTGYDATGSGSAGGPNIATNDGHGTSCAGIVAAVGNNNLGTAGIAYGAKVIPIRIAYSNGLPLGDPLRKWVSSDSWIAGGINYATTAGADVLSNSWGGGSPSSTITNAINNAVSTGRAGKGAVVLFSTGNENGNVAFPATNSNVIAVGASNTCDQRKTPLTCDGENWGGNFGTGIDLMAPGVQIYTSDLTGASGYSFNDYFSVFNGTSAACPNAAGVIALILGVNPNLTGVAARNILETTCDKVGGYSYQFGVSGQPNGSWCGDAGYGRVNACAAVVKALNLTVSGPAVVCASGTYTVPGLPAGLSVVWTSSNTSVATVTQSGNQATLTKVGNGTVVLSANIQGCQSNVVSMNVSIGLPASVNVTITPTPATASGFLLIDINEPYYNFDAVNLPGYTYQWVFQPLLSSPPMYISTPNEPSMWIESYSSGATYTASLVLSNSCASQTVWRQKMKVTGSSMFTVSPNPASDVIAIQPKQSAVAAKTMGASPVVTEVRVYDQMGNLKRQQSFGAGTPAVQVNVSGLKEGLYYVEINTGKVKEKQTFIISR